jgi:hypothetical protein
MPWMINIEEAARTQYLFQLMNTPPPPAAIWTDLAKLVERN